MTDIEKQALELVSELQEEDEGRKYSYAYYFKALCRAIERHEAFRQEVSDALRGQFIGGIPDKVARFIIPKPDPLEMAREEAEKRAVEVAATHEGPTDNEVRLMQDAAYFAVREFEKSIVKHGLEIRDKANG